VRYAAPALEKGLDILEMLAAQPHGLSLQEIARRLERTPNELFRMLDVLVRRGYLSRLPDSTYALTLRLFELAQRHPPVERLLNVAMPYMQQLAAQTGQSNHLCVHHDARLVVLARAEPPEPMSALVRQGAHFAFHDDRASARPSAARRASLVKRMRTIRARGYDEGPSDTLSGVVDICFPLFDQFGVVASLNIVYLNQRDARLTVPAARAALRKAAEAISISLGWLRRT
jgi:DNA-binding IclR family transcriptional regulator